jgi:zinc/manganese transport system ATP-binding protein
VMKPNSILEVRHVSVSYGSHVVLRDIDFQVQAGEFIGLIGPNGAGKTTLLKVILGLVRPTQGEVIVNGKPVRKGNPWVAYVPQKIHLDRDIPMRGRDFVRLGLDGHRWGIPLPSRTRRRRINDVLEAVDALSFADKPVGRLSGGEQQRLMIAQALLADPILLLLDEPLSNLDIRSAYEIVRLVERISKERGVAVLFVAHDVNPLLRVMDKVLYLAHGRAVMGTAQDVIRSDVLSRLYGYDVDVIQVQGRILVVGGSPVESTVLNVKERHHTDEEVEVQ